MSSPLEGARRFARAWPCNKLLVEDVGHGAFGVTAAIVAATDCCTE